MDLQALLSLGGVILSGGLAAVTLYRRPKSLVHITFAVGMVGLAVQETFTALSARSVSALEVLSWQRWRLFGSAVGLAAWLLFSLTFGRGSPAAVLGRRAWLIIGALVLPVGVIGLVGGSVFDGIERHEYGWVLRLGWPGYAVQVFLLLGAVLILMNLEKTLRASSGSMRWGIKFVTLGVGGAYAATIYTSSQALLFSALDTALQVITSGALLVAALLISTSLLRTRLLELDLYFSPSLIYRSLTIVFVGAYLLAVGVIAQVVRHVGGVQALPLAGLAVFLALMGLAIVLLSDEARQRTRRFISRNLRRPHYDYRREWMEFTRRTTSLVDMRALSAAVARMVSETFSVPSVTLWVLDESEQNPVPAASTVFSEDVARALAAGEPEREVLVRFLCSQQAVVDLRAPGGDWPSAVISHPLRSQGDLRYCVPLAAGRESLGFITLGDRPSGETLSVEDLDLLKTIADQAAASLLLLRLSERLLKAKEMEAFQSLSAFFIHDLKNLASRLSLTMQNLPAHYDDPAFRQDMLSTISRSVAKINDMCSRLSPLSRRLELQRSDVDLNDLVTETLAGLGDALPVSVVMDLQPLPRISLDPEQVQKVLVNLVLNACEATPKGGEIRVATGLRDGGVLLTVSDTGTGMSKEFVARSLFQPFQSTKPRGLGIGLFHSRKIVEAHLGRIEVDTKEGTGSTFRVLFPARPDEPVRQDGSAEEELWTKTASSS